MTDIKIPIKYPYIETALNEGYKISGVVTSDNLPELAEDNIKEIYIVSDEFTTTEDFSDGIGIVCPSGTNITVVNEGTEDEDLYRFKIMDKYLIQETENVLVETHENNGIYTIEQNDQKFLSSIEYVPDFQQDNMVFKDAAKLLDVLTDKSVFEQSIQDIESYYEKEIQKLDPLDIEAITALKAERDARINSLTKSYKSTLKEINQAYSDTLYKYSDYNKLSYGAKITLLQELGFDYILDLLLHMYDYDYKDEVKAYQKGEKDSILPYNEYVQNKADTILTKLVKHVV
jgi:hypothetical protein